MVSYVSVSAMPALLCYVRWAPMSMPFVRRLLWVQGTKMYAAGRTVLPRSAEADQVGNSGKKKTQKKFINSQ